MKISDGEVDDFSQILTPIFLLTIFQRDFGKRQSNLFAVFKMKKTMQNCEDYDWKSGDESPTLVSENDSVPIRIESSSMNPQNLAVWVDKICAVVFPVLYTAFNIFYWEYYL